MMMKEEEEAGNPDLIEVIRERIKRKGRIPFAEYMDMALYWPALGYYTSPGRKIGWEGDYYTSPDLHPLFGQMMGRQLARAADQVSDSALTVLEIGAGKGLLGLDLLNHVREEHPAFYDRVTYLILERSPAMIDDQKKYLGPYEQAGKVRWIEGLKDSGISKGLTGFVLSNELFDAFPVHRLVRAGGELKEIYVELKDGHFSEVLDLPSSPELAGHFEKLKLRLQEGQHVEVSLEAMEWMREVGRLIHKGIVISVDYGYPAGELFSPSRMRGTFLCYYKHRVSEDPYIRVGWQDMTAHVDFTSLAQAGQEAGLEVAGFTSQEYFLIGLGAAQEIEKRLGRLADDSLREAELSAMKQLISPTGMGKVFKILIQQKAMRDLRMDGLAYRPFSPELLFSL